MRVCGRAVDWDIGAVLHAGGLAGRGDELVEHQVAAVGELAREPVPVPRGGVRGEVAPLVVKPALATDRRLVAVEHEGPLGGEPWVGVIGRGGARALLDDPVSAVEYVGLDRGQGQLQPSCAWDRRRYRPAPEPARRPPPERKAADLDARLARPP